METLAYDQPHHRLYAADDFVVFYLGTAGGTWARLGTGLPDTPVMDIKVTGDGTAMYAATFDRSVWRLPPPPA